LTPGTDRMGYRRQGRRSAISHGCHVSLLQNSRLRIFLFARGLRVQYIPRRFKKGRNSLLSCGCEAHERSLAQCDHFLITCDISKWVFSRLSRRLWAGCPLLRNGIPIIEMVRRGDFDSRPDHPVYRTERLRIRTLAEQGFGRLKESFGARTVRVRGSTRVMAHLMFGVLALTADRILALAN